MDMSCEHPRKDVKRHQHIQICKKTHCHYAPMRKLDHFALQEKYTHAIAKQENIKISADLVASNDTKCSPKIANFINKNIHNNTQIHMHMHAKICARIHKNMHHLCSYACFCPFDVKEHTKLASLLRI